MTRDHSTTDAHYGRRSEVRWVTVDRVAGLGLTSTEFPITQKHRIVRLRYPMASKVDRVNDAGTSFRLLLAKHHRPDIDYPFSRCGWASIVDDNGYKIVAFVQIDRASCDCSLNKIAIALRAEGRRCCNRYVSEVRGVDFLCVWRRSVAAKDHAQLLQCDWIWDMYQLLQFARRYSVGRTPRRRTVGAITKVLQASSHGAYAAGAERCTVSAMIRIAGWIIACAVAFDVTFIACTRINCTIGNGDRVNNRRVD